MGGLAVNAWAIPAPTYDIDLCISLPEAEVARLVKDLEKDGFVPPTTSWIETIGRAKFREFSVTWPFQDGLIATDFFLAEDPFQVKALERRRTVELDEGFRTEILSPEDLLVYKLIAWRKKDQEALSRLLAVQRQLDWAYVRTWASRFGVLERLREAMSDAGLGAD